MEQSPEIEITYYTDPLCSWSWALEPHWQRVQEDHAGRLRWRYRMGGMLPSWEAYHDPLNSVSTPAQMAPQWYYVRSVTGVPLDEHLWLEDPPGSSYPACIAFKAAERQGPPAAEDYIRRLRRAAMLERRNVARREVLLELAWETATAGRLNVERFERELEDAATLDAFRDDLKEARYRSIGRFPALAIRWSSGRNALLVGYRPYEELRRVLERGAGLPSLR